jgi:hypothetical protein
MHIGVDFDNTIVGYDALFHRVCRERGMIPTDVPVSKSEVRNYLRRVGREEDWTEMQGYVYGARMSEAEPFPGVTEFFTACREIGITVSIISHKTRHPYLGQRYDLHETALAWLEQHGFFDKDKVGLSRETVFLELTKQAKLERIRQCGCNYFIDDLPEFLLQLEFPADVRRILFDPHDHYSDLPGYLRVKTWPETWDIVSRANSTGPAPLHEPENRPVSNQ